MIEETDDTSGKGLVESPTASSGKSSGYVTPSGTASTENGQTESISRDIPSNDPGIDEENEPDMDQLFTDHNPNLLRRFQGILPNGSMSAVWATFDEQNKLMPGDQHELIVTESVTDGDRRVDSQSDAKQRVMAWSCLNNDSGTDGESSVDLPQARFIRQNGEIATIDLDQCRPGTHSIADWSDADKNDFNLGPFLPRDASIDVEFTTGGTFSSPASFGANEPQEHVTYVVARITVSSSVSDERRANQSLHEPGSDEVFTEPDSIEVISSSSLDLFNQALVESPMDNLPVLDQLMSRSDSPMPPPPIPRRRVRRESSSQSTEMVRCLPKPVVVKPKPKQRRKPGPKAKPKAPKQSLRIRPDTQPGRVQRVSIRDSEDGTPLTSRRDSPGIARVRDLVRRSAARLTRRPANQMRGPDRRFFDIFTAAELRRGALKGRLPDGSYDHAYLHRRRENIVLVLQEECWNAMLLLRNVGVLQARANLTNVWDHELRSMLLSYFF